MHLDDLGFPVELINVGESARDSEKNANSKAEYYWGLRERFEQGDLSRLVDETTISQLATIKYKHTSRGQVQIESKEDAEITVKKIDPKWWLSRMHRERPDAPGWNDTRSIEVTGKDGDALIPITLARQVIDAVENGDDE